MVAWRRTQRFQTRPIKDRSQLFCVLFLNNLYEHHCYRKYSDKLDESSEGFFWEEFYHTDSEQGSDSYYREHQEVQRKRAPVDVVPGKDLERNFQQIDDEEEPGVKPMYSILLLLNIAGKLTGLLSDGERMSVSLLNSLVSRFLRDTNGLRPVNEMRLFSLSAMLERVISLLYRIF